VSDIDDAVEMIKNMTLEQLTEALAELRRRQEVQRAFKPKVLTCDKCLLTIPAGNAAHNVAISSQTVTEEYLSNEDNLFDFDPQYEAILCTECWQKVIALLPTGS
jgi:hypothetical protein